MSKNFDRAESRIVQNLHSNPDNMNKVYGELISLQHKEGRSAFRRDLAQINHDLHAQGLLPHMQIVETSKTRMGFTLKPDNGEPGGGGGRRGDAGHFDASPGAREKQGRRGRSNGHDQAESQDEMPGDKKTYDGASGRAGVFARQNAQIVADVAKRMGVDPVTAVATMLVESRGNPHAVGDHGTSFGLFQLHRGGALGNLSKQQAFDPELNARTALKEFLPNLHKYNTPGELAAASQRPAHRHKYARMVNGSLSEARALLGMS